MANAVIGALRVSLGLDSAQFQAGLKSGEAALGRFADQARKAFAAVTAAGTAMAGAMAVGIRNAINEADNMSKAAQRFGTTTEELSRLKHAADLSGVSFEGLGTSMRILSRNMVEVASGAKNATSEAFRALGIEVRNADGSLKTSSQVMTEVAGKFAQMENGAQKTALAMAIFGRSGADLIPMLNAGADGFASMMAEADQLGIVINTNTARAAEAFNDNLSRLWKVKDALFIKLSEHLLPALERMSEEFLAFVQNEAAVKATAESIGNMFGFIGREVSHLVTDVARARAEIMGLVEAIKLLGQREWSAAIEAFRAGQQESDRLLKEFQERAEQGAAGVFTSQGQIQRRIDDAFSEGGESAGNEFTDGLERSVAGGAGRVRAAIDPMAREAARVFEQTRTPLERYQAEIARLNDMLQAGAISQDTYNRAVLQAQDAFDQATKAGENAKDTFSDIGNSIANTFANAFSGLIDGSRKVSDVLRGLLGQLTSMALNSAFRSIFNAGSGGSSGGGIFATIARWFGGARANGGPVSANRAYLVGERGPELMVPNSSGTVISNRDLSSMGRGGGGEASVLQVQLSPDLIGQILKQAKDQSISITRASNSARQKLWQNGGEPR
jgi:hypothetical protein